MASLAMNTARSGFRSEIWHFANLEKPCMHNKNMTLTYHNICLLPRVDQPTRNIARRLVAEPPQGLPLASKQQWHDQA